MKRFESFGAAALVLVLAACGGGDSGDTTAEAPAAAPAAAPAEMSAEMTMPDWYRIDEGAQTVELDISAEMDGGWKFNGLSGGEGTIYVPVGYTVTINFTNNDPAMVHSVGIDSRTSGFPPAFDANPTPVFEGAISSNPTSMTEATAPGASETFTFTVDTAGEYAMVCYIPAHALSGMYVAFVVSADGESGVAM